MVSIEGTQADHFRQMAVLILCVLLAAITGGTVGAQPMSFISLSCGLLDGLRVIDSSTGLDYISDYSFIRAGIAAKVADSYFAKPEVYHHVRSFPAGERNCYMLHPVPVHARFLVRTQFFHGNYDGTNPSDNHPVTFDLHIGTDYWETVNVSDPTDIIRNELIGVTLSESLSICLIKTGSSTPFMSVLEFRIINGFYYLMSNTSLYVKTQERYHMSTTNNNIIRYPDDQFDRIWQPDNTSRVITLNNNNNSFESDARYYGVPLAALYAAQTPETGNWLSRIFPADPQSFYYHFCNGEKG